MARALVLDLFREVLQCRSSRLSSDLGEGWERVRLSGSNLVREIHRGQNSAVGLLSFSFVVIIVEASQFHALQKVRESEIRAKRKTLMGSENAVI